MTLSEHIRVDRFFAVDVAGYESYESVRRIVERADAVDIRANRVPYTPPWVSVFALLTFDRTERSHERRIGVEWVENDCEVMGRREDTVWLAPDIVAPTEVSISFVANFTDLVFRTSESYHTSLILDGEEIDRLSVDVVPAAGSA